ncbi:tetratricopeptide repeat-containing sensor histidine kinase [Tenacibaculum xiamenense]|uniref:tetratricopeptide repeat-containing sensor histidine kinase n=1 Tax=Tenacibaculum xiamenense TaxID=1261553 RepID=UPI003894CBA2
MKVIILFFSVVLYANLYGQNKEKTNYDKIIDSIRKELIEIDTEEELEYKYYSLGYYFNKINQSDSAYKYISKSKDICLKLKDTLKTVQRMFSLAKIESKKDFFSKSDSTAIQALRFLGRNKGRYKITVSLYNTLGVNANYQGNYQEAVRCYNKVLAIAKDSVNIIWYKSNIASNLTSLKSYVKANEIYENIKSSHYFDSIPKGFKAVVFDNHAYTKLLNNEEIDESDFMKGQKIKREINDFDGLMTNYLYLSEYYQKIEDIKNARKYAYLAHDLALELNITSTRIMAIDRILSLEPESRARELSIEKSNILDSIQKQRNEFATTIYNYKDEVNKRIIAESNLSKTQLQKQKWIFAVCFVIVGFIVYFFYKRGQTKKEKIIEVYKTETRLAKKIHDELANDIFLVMNKVQQNENSDGTVLNHLEKIYMQTRNISHENSPVVTGKKFEGFFKQLLSEFSTNQCRIISKGISDIHLNKLPKETQIVFYRVFQELLINMKKYSNASLVVINFREEKDLIHVTFKDNGVGVDAIKIKNGLQNMETRIKSINGSITFDSEVNKGFQVKFQIKK